MGRYLSVSAVDPYCGELSHTKIAAGNPKDSFHASFGEKNSRIQYVEHVFLV